MVRRLLPVGGDGQCVKARWLAAVSVFLSFVRFQIQQRRPRLLDFSSIAGHEISGAAAGVSLAVSFSYSLELLVPLRLYAVSENDSFCQLVLQKLPRRNC